MPGASPWLGLEGRGADPLQAGALRVGAGWSGRAARAARGELVEVGDAVGQGLGDPVGDGEVPRVGGGGQAQAGGVGVGVALAEAVPVVGRVVQVDVGVGAAGERDQLPEQLLGGWGGLGHGCLPGAGPSRARAVKAGAAGHYQRGAPSSGVRSMPGAAVAARGGRRCSWAVHWVSAARSTRRASISRKARNHSTAAVGEACGV